MDTHGPEVKDLVLESYLAAIRNSIGAQTWREYYATVDGVRQEITRGGELSCAYFVTTILAIFGLIKETHLTVPKTEADLTESGWTKITGPRPGAVVVYEEQQFGDERHAHIGFCVAEGRAISQSTRERTPVEHAIDRDSDGQSRVITAIYWHPKLRD